MQILDYHELSSLNHLLIKHNALEKIIYRFLCLKVCHGALLLVDQKTHPEAAFITLLN